MAVLLAAPSLTGAPASASRVEPEAARPWALSGTVQQAYDDNVYLVSGLGAAPIRSWVSSAAARFAWERPRSAGDTLEALSLCYAPEAVRYHSANSEDYLAHRLSAVGRFRRGQFNGNFDVSCAVIDGDKVAPYYSVATHDDQRSAYATAAARDRRSQTQVRAKGSVTLDRPGWFCRVTGSLLSIDLGTKWRAEPGYQNYVDRRDLTGGGDFGWNLPAGMNATVGYRRGYQFQQMLPTAIDRTQANASGGFDRFLLGLEGKPMPGMTFSIQSGPETHRFPGNSATRTVLVSAREQTRWFTEASFSTTVRPGGTATLKYKRWMWLSSTGKVPLIETTFEATYRRSFWKRYALDLGFKAAASDYRCGSGSASLRNDWMYSSSLKLSANVTPRLLLAVGTTQDLGRNGKDDLAAVAPTQLPGLREFNHHAIFLTVTLKH